MSITAVMFPATVAQTTLSASPLNTLISTTSESDDVTDRNTTQTMSTYTQDTATSGADNLTHFWNYTTITPEAKTLNPNLTLEGKWSQTTIH